MKARRVVAGFLAVFCGLIVLAARPAAAHPLGNFTVNHYDGLVVKPTGILDHAVIDAAEIPASQLRRSIDTDNDGAASAAERRRYAEDRCAALAADLRLSVDGQPRNFEVQTAAFSFEPGAAGLKTARLDCSLWAPADLGDRHTVSFADDFDAARLGWHELAAVGSGVAIDTRSVPQRSVSDELRKYPNDLLSSPLDVREATFRVQPGAGPSSRVPLNTPTAGRLLRSVDRLNGAFTDLVGRRDITLGVGLLAVALALLLGATHAALPGHGKTVMAAYLAGRHGTKRDAVIVGATVTLTHTIGVLALGLALTASTALAGEEVLGWLGVTSGVLVAALGVALIVGHVRDRSRRRDSRVHSDHHHHEHHHHGPGDHHHAPVGITRRGLVGMGVAGGLVPSPSALVVLLAAIALGRTIFGVLLVVSYGLGMAATLTAAGLVLVRLRDRFEGRPVRGAGRTRRFAGHVSAALPIATACLVTIVGVALASRSLTAI